MADSRMSHQYAVLGNGEITLVFSVDDRMAASEPLGARLSSPNRPAAGAACRKCGNPDDSSKRSDPCGTCHPTTLCYSPATREHAGRFQGTAPSSWISSARACCPSGACHTMDPARVRASMRDALAARLAETTQSIHDRDWVERYLMPDDVLAGLRSSDAATQDRTRNCLVRISERARVPHRAGERR